MEFVRLLIGLVLCILVLWWMLNADSRKSRKFEALIRARQPVDSHEFEERYFRCDEVPLDFALRVRSVFSRLLGISEEQLLPDDDFQTLIIGAEEDILEAVEAEFGIAIPDSIAPAMKPTIRSISMAIAREINGKAQAS